MAGNDGLQTCLLGVVSGDEEILLTRHRGIGQLHRSDPAEVAEEIIGELGGVQGKDAVVIGPGDVGADFNRVGSSTADKSRRSQVEIVVKDDKVVATAGDDGVTDRVDDEGVITGATDQGLCGVVGNKNVSECGGRTVEPVANLVAGDGLATQDAIVTDKRQIEGIGGRRAQRANGIRGGRTQGSNSIRGRRGE